MTVLTEWRKHYDSFFSWHFIFQPRSDTRASMTHPVNHEVWTDSPSSARWDISQGNTKILIGHGYNCRSQRTLSDPAGREHLDNIQTKLLMELSCKPSDPALHCTGGEMEPLWLFLSHLEIWNKIAQPVVRSLFRLKKMTWGHDVLAVHLLAGCTLKTKPLTNQDQQRYKILDLCFPVWLYLQSGRKNENIWVNFISCCFLNVIDYKCVLVMVVFLQMFLPLYTAVLKQLILHMLHHKCCRVFAVQPRTNSASTQIHSSMRSTLRVFLF